MVEPTVPPIPIKRSLAGLDWPADRRFVRCHCRFRAVAAPVSACRMKNRTIFAGDPYFPT
jgi:hypothetical protein